ncbi:hypothetical protein Tco_0789475 [Tanacetum coccineum]
MTKITDVEASLEQFKSVSLAYEEETSNRFDRMQESIDKNKADADKQFAKLLQLLKSLQPPTTLLSTIPRFEENSRQCFSSDEVEKEGLLTFVHGQKAMLQGSNLGNGMINKNEFAVVAPVVVVAPVAPVVVAPVELSFVQLGRKIKQNQAEQKLGCENCLQERVPAQRRT